MKALLCLSLFQTRILFLPSSLKTMQHNCTAFLERNADVPEVQSALKSVKFLTKSKDIFLKRLSFEAEPADFAKFLSAAKFNKRQSKEEQHGG
jgi:hypothetical protein